MTVPVPASQLGETVLEMIELQIDWQTSESGEGVPVWEWPKAQAALAELVSLAEQASSLAARTEKAEAALRRATYIARNLHEMIDQETWRATGGDDMQGHYEGDYHAANLHDEIKNLAALAPAPAEETT